MNDATITAFLLYASQATFGIITVFVLQGLNKNQDFKYFRYWYRSWFAFILYVVFSGLSLLNVLYLPAGNPVRLGVSILATVFGFSQGIWLLAGSYELRYKRAVPIKSVWVILVFFVFIAIFLVLFHHDDPDGKTIRFFYRIGIRSGLIGIIFVLNSALIYSIRDEVFAFKYVLIGLCLYALTELNYFAYTLFQYLGLEYFVSVRYYFEILDFFSMSLIATGIVMSAFEFKKAQLERSNSVLNTYLYQTSHVLRAPITRIQSAIEVKKGEGSFTQLDELIKDSAEKADEVIRKIISLRQGQEKKQIFEELNVAEVIQEVIQELDGPNIFSSVDKSLVVTSDKDQFKLVLHAILDNSIAYSTEEKEIRIQTRTENKRLRIIITDQGIGIPEAALGKVFEMFYKGNDVTNGPGLGLHLAKEIIQQLNGEISLESSKAGTSVTLTLPFNSVA